MNESKATLLEVKEYPKATLLEREGDEGIRIYVTLRPGKFITESVDYVRNLRDELNKVIEQAEEEK